METIPLSHIFYIQRLKVPGIIIFSRTKSLKSLLCFHILIVSHRLPKSHVFTQTTIFRYIFNQFFRIFLWLWEQRVRSLRSSIHDICISPELHAIIRCSVPIFFIWNGIWGKPQSLIAGFFPTNARSHFHCFCVCQYLWHCYFGSSVNHSIMELQSYFNLQHFL